MRSLGFATDVLAMSGESVIEHHPRYSVQRSPKEPNFWFGNRVMFHDPPLDAAPLIAQFHAVLPEAKHICLGWDIPNLSAETVRAVFADTGLEIDKDDVLTLRGPAARRDPPEGILIRPLAESDWTQSEDICFVDLMRAGYPEDGMRTYLAKRSVARQAQIARGLGQWFGAFDGDLLVADMGIFHDAEIARYQSVQTRESHRRRGICAALLAHSLDWVLDRAPDVTAVIVAAADSDAGRLYRRAGFALTETMVSVFRPPK